MKKISLAISLLFCINILLNAQNVNVLKKTFKLDINSVVKDSAGNRLPFAEWHPKVISGKYIIIPNDKLGDSAVFFIFESGKPLKNYNNGWLSKQKNGLKSNSSQNINTSFNNDVPPPMPPESPSFKIGQKLVNFSARDIKGNKIKLNELNGKVVVLNFWFIGCPPCMQEIPELNKIVDKYANNPNVVFLAIGLDGRYDIKQFLKTNPYNFDIIDDGRYYANLYNVTLYPTTVILDKARKVMFNTVSFGPNSPYWINKTIDGLL